MVPAGTRQIGWIQEMRALLVARRQLLGRLVDVELSIRGILRGFGLKVGQVTRKTFEARIWELVTGQATPMRGLSQPLQEISATAGMRGGGCTPDRTSLQLEIPC